MDKPLFANVGKDLKLFARVIHAICTIAYIIVGLLLFISSCALFGSGDEILVWFGLAGIVIAILVFVLGYFLSKLLVMGIYAYGELVDKAISIDNKLSTKKPMPTPKPPVRPVPKPAPTAWVCPFCDQLNTAGSTQCKKCSAEYNCWEETPQ